MNFEQQERNHTHTLSADCEGQLNTIPHFILHYEKIKQNSCDVS
jgi:hypothetical protein